MLVPNIVEYPKDWNPLTLPPSNCILFIEIASNIKCPRCGRTTPDATFCQYCGRSLHRCRACGARISKTALFCPECGAPIVKEDREAIAVERTSWLWWLLPILFAFVLSWLGGVIGWSAIRHRDPNKATLLLWFGISLTVIGIIVIVVVRVIQH